MSYGTPANADNSNKPKEEKHPKLALSLLAYTLAQMPFAIANMDGKLPGVGVAMGTVGIVASLSCFYKGVNPHVCKAAAALSVAHFVSDIIHAIANTADSSTTMNITAAAP